MSEKQNMQPGQNNTVVMRDRPMVEPVMVFIDGTTAHQIPSEAQNREHIIMGTSNINGPRPSTEASPSPFCQVCGKPVDLRHKNVLVETVEKSITQPTEAIAWHQDCYDQYLESGEEC